MNNIIKKKMMVVTTGRADYGLLYPLIKKILKSNQIELQLIATGSHLSENHGMTLNQIKEDQEIRISGIVDLNMSKDTEAGICAAISVGLVKFSKLYETLCPDLLIVLGDRYELWSVCMAAVIHKIPIAHIHGGETTSGVIDEAIRHSVTKMSAFHFASINEYAARIIQMGENPDRVFVVGAIGIDNIATTPLMSRTELSEFTQFNFNKDIALMTYHPVTLDHYNSAEYQIEQVLNALKKTDFIVLMTMPNADTSGTAIYQKIKTIVKNHPDKFKFVKSLGQRAYLSAMQYSKLMVGNSSSGIIEAASFKLPVVNIGDRQSGRFKPANVIDCDCSEASIKKAIYTACSKEFKKSISGLKSPFGDGTASKQILKILEAIDIKKKSLFIKKKFYDLIDPALIFEREI